jgi:hypothetical protein
MGRTTFIGSIAYRGLLNLFLHDIFLPEFGINSIFDLTDQNFNLLNL